MRILCMSNDSLLTSPKYNIMAYILHNYYTYRYIRIEILMNVTFDRTPVDAVNL